MESLVNFGHTETRSSSISRVGFLTKVDGLSRTVVYF
jgi:hypothetical protein